MQLINTIILKDNYTWILHNMQNKAIIFDCGNASMLDKFLISKNLTPSFICITHNHYDHTDGVLELATKYGAKIVAHASLQNLFNVDMVIKPLEVIEMLGEKFKIYDAHGHTNNQMIYHNVERKLLFVGDVLFNLGCGLLIDGSYEAMFEDMKLLRTFDGEHRVLCGHNYTKANALFLQSLGLNSLSMEDALDGVKDNLLQFEFNHNPFLRYDDIALKALLQKNDLDDFDFFVYLRKLRNKFKIWEK